MIIHHRVFINIEISQYTNRESFWFVNLWSFFSRAEKAPKENRKSPENTSMWFFGVCVICGLVALVTLGFCYEGYRLNSPCGRPYWNSNGQVDRKGRPYWNCCMLCWMMTWSSASMLHRYWNWDVQLLPKNLGSGTVFPRKILGSCIFSGAIDSPEREKLETLKPFKPWHFYSSCEARCAFCVHFQVEIFEDTRGWETP